MVTTTNPDQTLLLTIPYDKNIKVLVDGKKVTATKSFSIYTGFTIKKAGEHTVVIKYNEPIFQIGLPVGIFVLGATIFAHFALKKNPL